MKILRKYPMAAVALTITASGLATYFYARVQLDQQACSAMQTDSKLTMIRSQLGLVDSKIAMLPRLREPAPKAPLPSGIMTLEDYAKPKGFDVQQEAEGQQDRLAQLFLDRMESDLDALELDQEITQLCLSKNDYSALLAFLQIALASLASLVAFIVGSLKGGADQPVLAARQPYAPRSSRGLPRRTKP